MIQNLDALAEKIYQEGVEKAENKAVEITEDAEKKAEEIVQKAKQDAKAIKEKAEKEADAVHQNALADIKLAGQQALSSLKQEIKKAISAQVLEAPVKKAFDDPEFVKKLILEVSQKMSENNDIKVVLPEGTDSAFKSSLSQKLPKTSLTFDGRLKSGFRIELTKEGYALSFSEGDFVEFLKPFVNKKTEELLFNNK
ncbi:MAG TPA: hypothetical protein DDY13_07830 [Cytophagales bacterium]|jgi:V/A-type H+-transporting ATPase subunit E|nr:hypothetical protein [Cytophagales bacterium]